MCSSDDIPDRFGPKWYFHMKADKPFLPCNILLAKHEFGCIG